MQDIFTDQDLAIDVFLICIHINFLWILKKYKLRQNVKLLGTAAWNWDLWQASQAGKCPLQILKNLI